MSKVKITVEYLGRHGTFELDDTALDKKEQWAKNYIVKVIYDDIKDNLTKMGRE